MCYHAEPGGFCVCREQWGENAQQNEQNVTESNSGANIASGMLQDMLICAEMFLL